MPLASKSSSSNTAAAAAAAADEADSVREHARNMVKMADMTIMSTEKVERKAVEGGYDESAVDFLLEGSDASNLDLCKAEDSTRSVDKEGRAAIGSGGKGVRSDGGITTTKKAAPGNGDGDDSDFTGIAGGGDGDDAKKPTDSIMSLGGLSTANAPISDNASAEMLREQLTQTRRALLQVRENAKLKHRKLELEHTTVKKELKKAKGT